MANVEVGAPIPKKRKQPAEKAAPKSVTQGSETVKQVKKTTPDKAIEKSPKKAKVAMESVRGGIVVDRKAFLASLDLAFPAVQDGNTVLKGADTFVFSEGRVYTFNEALSISTVTPLPEELYGAVKAVELRNLVKKFKTDTFELVEKDNTWQLYSGNAMAELTLLQDNVVSKVISITSDLDWEVLPESFHYAMASCKMSCNNSKLSGIYVTDDGVYSTDGFKVNHYALMEDEAMETFWISDEAATELIKVGKSMTHYSLAPRWAHFKSSDVVFSCSRLTEDKFPIANLQAVLEQSVADEDDLSGVFSSDLKDAIDMAGALGIDLESANAVKLTFSADGVLVEGIRTTGKFTELVPWENPRAMSGIESTEVFIESAMLSTIKDLKKFHLKEGKKNTYFVFTNERYTHMYSTLRSK